MRYLFSLARLHRVFGKLAHPSLTALLSARTRRDVLRIAYFVARTVSNERCVMRDVQMTSTTV